jgi:hypothetical protein
MTTAKKYLEILREREPQLWEEPLKESVLTESDLTQRLSPVKNYHQKLNRKLENTIIIALNLMITIAWFISYPSIISYQQR